MFVINELHEARLRRLLMTFLSIVPLAGACSGNDSDDGGVPNKPNPCATKGATYLLHCDRKSGDCPDLPDQITNTPTDGSPDDAVCDDLQFDGCTARGTDCKKQTDNGCFASLTYKTVFAEDGSSATSINTMKIDCGNDGYCASTYECTATRQ